MDAPGSAPSPQFDPGTLVRVLPAGTMEGVTVEEHLDAAAEAGFDAVSLRPGTIDTWRATSGGTLGVLARRLRALALGLAEVDPVVGWSDPRRWAAPDLPSAVLAVLDDAAELGARAVTALVAPGEPWEVGPGAEGLAALCAAASTRTLSVQVEPFCWSALADVTEAAAVVERVGAADAGVLVDTWHHQRRGGDATSLDRVPVEMVVGVQVSDGPVEPLVADLAEDCRTGRTWPGDPAGQQHPELVLARLVERGWSGPVAVEVFGPVDDPYVRASRAATALDELLAATADLVSR